MMYLEKKKGEPMRLVITCETIQDYDLVRLALDAFSWDPDVNQKPEFLRALEAACQEIELYDDERIYITKEVHNV